MWRLRALKIRKYLSTTVSQQSYNNFKYNEENFSSNGTLVHLFTIWLRNVQPYNFRLRRVDALMKSLLLPGVTVIVYHA